MTGSLQPSPVTRRPVESPSFSHLIHGEYRCWAEKRLSEKWAEVEARIVITHFPQVGKRILGHDSFDSWFDCS